MMNDEQLTTRERFESEMAQIAFRELQKHFAKGILIIVSSELDMVDVAMKLHADDTQSIQRWMDNDQLIRAHDEHAKVWLEHDTEFMAVTAAPWVLVQELTKKVN
jgi:hypothetical protein